MVNPESETVTYKYYQVEELPPLVSDLDSNISCFHLYISSLPFHFEELYTLLTLNNLKFKVRINFSKLYHEKSSGKDLLILVSPEGPL